MRIQGSAIDYTKVRQELIDVPGEGLCSLLIYKGLVISKIKIKRPNPNGDIWNNDHLTNNKYENTRTINGRDEQLQLFR